MRLLVLSDIHADAEGLTAVLDHAGSTGFDQVALLGDLIGYGSEPGRTLELLSGLNVLAAVQGNHEDMLGRLRSGRQLAVSAAVRAPLEHCLRELSAEQLDCLEAMPDYGLAGGLHLVHGSPQNRFAYVLGSVDARKAEQHLLADICLIGHSHLPGIFLKETAEAKWVARPARRETHSWQLREGARAILNPGSVWQNRDRVGGRSYGLLEADSDGATSFTVQRL